MNMIGEVEPSEETLDTLETKVTWYTHVHKIVSNIVFSQRNVSYPFYLCHCWKGTRKGM